MEPTAEVIEFCLERSANKVSRLVCPDGPTEGKLCPPEELAEYREETLLPSSNGSWVVQAKLCKLSVNPWKSPEHEEFSIAFKDAAHRHKYHL
jgi:hypothetical protein